MTATKTAEKPAKAKAEKEQKPKIERVRQNGQTRPVVGSKTGLVWDIADQISKDKKRPALRDEVFDAYLKQVPDGSKGTCGTQYSRWSQFHNVGPVLKKMRDDEKKAKAEQAKADKKAKEDEKAAKEAEKAKAKEAKAKKEEKKAA